jgi:hypothetical protein
MCVDIKSYQVNALLACARDFGIRLHEGIVSLMIHAKNPIIISDCESLFYMLLGDENVEIIVLKILYEADHRTTRHFMISSAC